MSTNQQENYGYGLLDGPHTWNGKYYHSDLKRQSPVNIDSRLGRIVKQKRSMLSMEHFEEMPIAMQLKITSHTGRVFT